MWLKTEDGQYVNPDNGSVLFVSRYTDTVDDVHGATLWRVQSEVTGTGVKTLRAGYPTENEAHGALDEFMSAQELVEIQPPVTDEETSDAETEVTK